MEKLKKIAIGMSVLQTEKEKVRLTKSEAGYRVAFSGEPNCGRCPAHLLSNRCSRVIGSYIRDFDTCDLVETKEYNKNKSRVIQE